MSEQQKTESRAYELVTTLNWYDGPLIGWIRERDSGRLFFFDVHSEVRKAGRELDEPRRFELRDERGVLVGECTSKDIDITDQDNARLRGLGDV